MEGENCRRGFQQGHEGGTGGEGGGGGLSGSRYDTEDAVSSNLDKHMPFVSKSHLITFSFAKEQMLEISETAGVLLAMVFPWKGVGITWRSKSGFVAGCVVLLLRSCKRMS